MDPKSLKGTLRHTIKIFCNLGLLSKKTQYNGKHEQGAGPWNPKKEMKMCDIQKVANIKVGETVTVTHIEVGQLTLEADINKNDGSVCVVKKNSKGHRIGYMRPETFLSIYGHGL